MAWQVTRNEYLDERAASNRSLRVDGRMTTIARYFDRFRSWIDDGQANPSGVSPPADGELVTLNQFIGMVKSYYAGLGTLSDDERLRIVARGVVRGAGGIGDWRVVVAFMLYRSEALLLMR